MEAVTGTSMEIEAKFSVREAETFRRLLEVPELAGLALSAGRPRPLRDTYLDTPAWSILAAGYVLRRREEAEGIRLTLKGAGGVTGAVHRREEVELVLPADLPPAEWPAGPLRERVLAWSGESALLPLVTLTQTRFIRRLSEGEREVAEFSLDEVTLSAGERRTSFRVLEIELAPAGTEADLAALVRALRSVWRLRPEPLSKFERAFAFAGGRLLLPYEEPVLQRWAMWADRQGQRARALLALAEGQGVDEVAALTGLTVGAVRYLRRRFRQQRLVLFPPAVGEASESPALVPVPLAPPAALSPALTRPGLEPDDPMPEAARKVLAFHFQQMLAHEAGTRLGEDPEELHDMRVATRRMRAAFNLFTNFLDARQMKPYLKGLRRAGRTLGAVRDLDVFHEKAQHYLAALPPERHDELAPLLAAWTVEREQARACLLAYLDSDLYRQFVGTFGEWLAHPQECPPRLSAEGAPLPYRVRHVTPGLIYGQLAAVRAYDEWLTGPDVPLARFHQLRIAFKGLRYTLEFFQEVLGPEIKPAINLLKGLQDHLGDLQDAVVASTLLRDFLTWGTWRPPTGKKAVAPAEPVIAPGVAAYLSARQAELQQLVATFPPVWEPVRGGELGRLVAAAVAAL